MALILKQLAYSNLYLNHLNNYLNPMPLFIYQMTLSEHFGLSVIYLAIGSMPLLQNQYTYISLHHYYI